MYACTAATAAAQYGYGQIVQNGFSIWLRVYNIGFGLVAYFFDF